MRLPLLLRLRRMWQERSIIIVWSIVQAAVARQLLHLYRKSLLMPHQQAVSIAQRFVAAARQL